MWLMTTTGFYSVVQKHGEKDLTVRARVADDLDRLRERYLPELSATIATPEADYPYRATIAHADLARGVEKMVRDIDYHNFKSEVGRRLGGAREHAYHDVWDALYGLEQKEAARTPRGGRR